MKTIKEFEKEIEELNNLIKNNPNNRESSIINRWIYLKHGKEAQVKKLKEVLKLIDEMKLHNSSDENRNYNLALKELKQKIEGSHNKGCKNDLKGERKGI